MKAILAILLHAHYQWLIKC